MSSSFTAHTDFLQIILGMDDKPLTVYELARDLYTSSCKGPNAITKSLPCRQFICDSLSQTVSDEPGKGIIFDHELAGKGSVKHWLLKYVITNPTFPGPGYSPVPRHSFAHIFDTKLREMSFEKQNSAKAVLFTMYVSTAGAKTFYHRKT